MLFLVLFAYIAASQANFEEVGVYDLLLQSSSLFNFNGKLYVLENILCDYHDHMGMYNSSFAKRSYSRIVDYESGHVVANISQTIAHSYVSALVVEDKVHLFGTQQDGCSKRQRKLMPTHWSTNDPEFKNWNRHHLFKPGNALSLPHLSVAYANGEYYMVSECFQFTKSSDPEKQDWTKVEGAVPPAKLPCRPTNTYFLTFADDYFYLFTSMNVVMLFRTKDFKTWEPSTMNPIVKPNEKDIVISDKFILSDSVETLQGFMKMQQFRKSWDWVSSDLSICCLNSDPEEGSKMMWKGSTDGRRPKSPLPAHMNSVTLIGKSKFPMREYLRTLFQVSDNEDQSSGESKLGKEQKMAKEREMRRKKALEAKEKQKKLFDQKFKNFNATGWNPFGKKPWQRNGKPKTLPKLPPQLEKKAKDMKEDYKKDLKFLEKKKFKMKNSNLDLGGNLKEFSGRAKAQSKAMLDAENNAKNTGWKKGSVGNLMFGKKMPPGRGL